MKNSLRTGEHKLKQINMLQQLKEETKCELLSIFNPLVIWKIGLTARFARKQKTGKTEEALLYRAKTPKQSA